MGDQSPGTRQVAASPGSPEKGEPMAEPLRKTSHRQVP